MMTNNGGFQSYFPPSGGNGSNGFHRSNTYMPPNPYQNPGYLPPQPMAPPQPLPPPQPLQHSNTYMPPPPQNVYAPPPQNTYVPPPQNAYVPPPQNTYVPPPQNAYVPPPSNPIPPPQNNYLQRSNTYMPPMPPQYQNPPPYPPQQPQQYFPPPQAPPYSARPLLRSNTYMAPLPSNQFQAPMAPPSNFNPEEDCKILRNAVHGIGTDERAIINIIVNRNLAQRQEIRRAYKACFGKDLIKRLQEDTSGNFKQVIKAMFMTPAEYDAFCLYKAMKGLGTDEGVLIEIIGTRNNQQLQEVKDVLQREYNNTLENWVKGDTSGNFRLLLIALLQCNRSTNPNPDMNVCRADAQALYSAGEGRWGTDEATFIRIFANRSAAEMACINQCYTQLRGKGLLKAIDKEFSGDIKKLLQTVVGGLLDPPGYFATRIREAVRGLGTNDTKLVRVIVSRCEIDLAYIKQAYQKIYHRDLLSDVRSDTSGYYRDILTGLITRC